MKLMKRWNERNRLMLTLELAVVLPVAALIAVSIHYLWSIQRDRAVEAAIQRDFSQVLKISEKQINEKANALVDDVRMDFPGNTRACSIDLDRILAHYPYAAHVYVFYPDGGLTFRSQQERMQDAAFREDANDISKMIDSWLKIAFDDMAKDLKMKAKKGNPFYYESHWSMHGEKHVYTTIAMFLGETDGGKKFIGGMVFDPDYLKKEFFPEALEAVMNRNAAESQGDKSHAVIMIHPKSESAPMAASAGWDGGEPEVERNMEGPFTGLTLAMKMRGTTLAAMGKHFAMTSYGILGALSLLLAGGLILTYRNVSKEIALARIKSDFVSNVSHELRTPLALIRLYAETLEMGRLKNPEKYHEYYQIIRKESERLSSLINNILDFSRIEAGRKEYDFRETDLRELVCNTMESYRYQIEQQGFTLEEKIDPVPPMKVDREAVTRSLVNLVNNALKYSQDQKYIGVNLYRDNGSVKLEVVDHGIGIPKIEQPKIFEKFYRVGDPLVHNTKGSGLGLSLVQHIVHAHGGAVQVESTPGRGSKFIISIPVQAAVGNGAAATI